MIRNYLKTALRIMMRQKAYSAINIAGLSIGIAATLLIVIYVLDEVSYDKFHQHSERIFRIGFSGKLQGTEMYSATSAAPVAEAMLREIPQVEDAVRFGVWRTMPMAYGDKAFTEPRTLVADSNFFRFFSFKLIAGNAETALREPNKIVVTESAARRYFGDENPIGKILLLGADKTATEVTGIVEDPPTNSHIDFDMILSGSTWDYMKSPYWTSNNLYTYIKARSPNDAAAIKTHLDRLVEKYMGADIEKFLGMNFKQFLEQGNNLGLFLQPFQEIHLTSNLSEEIIPNGNKQYLYIFSAIALFIILIACINFMNLSTARSANRAKEVGVRKTIGAVKHRLMFQFLSESMVYSILSTVLAIMIIGLTLQPFNILAGKSLDYSILSNPIFIAIIIIFTIGIGVLAGSYPAFYLAAFNPTDVLKGKVRAGFRNSALRNVLVVFQFIISIALIFGSMVVYKQLRFVQEKNLGFDKQNVVSLLHTYSLGENARAFKNELTSRPEFIGASFANRLPPNIDWNSTFRKGGTDQDFLLSLYYVDHDHLKAMGYQITEGRFFSREFASDTTAIILNESAFKQMGFEKFEEGLILRGYNDDPPVSYRLIGVIKDFNYESLRNDVKPMAVLLGGEPNYEMAIRLAPGQTQDKIALLESLWKKHANGAPFQFSFLDENFDALFRAEQRMSSIILVFTILAICIACLGLFGLATYTAEQRAKEISIRKVMGASVSQIMFLLSRDFTILVVIAFVIAAPLSWYFAHDWLSGFAYHTSIDVGLVVISGLVSLAIAMLTISYQSARAAHENPVKAMRSE